MKQAQRNDKYLVIIDAGSQGSEEINGLAGEVVDNGLDLLTLDAVMLHRNWRSQICFLDLLSLRHKTFPMFGLKRLCNINQCSWKPTMPRDKDQ